MFEFAKNVYVIEKKWPSLLKSAHSKTYNLIKIFNAADKKNIFADLYNYCKNTNCVKDQETKFAGMSFFNDRSFLDKILTFHVLRKCMKENNFNTLYRI